jgi:hypothetical protein|tara:strand:+ start:328 stop:510 length:183 start_codon:yes stop_codon:yes gene_type:complete
MSQKHRHIKSQHINTYKESYAIIQEPTNATFITKETMERNEETAGVQQESKTVHTESTLA